jgi:hypothetical protein
MYGVGQSPPERRGLNLKVIVGVMFLALMLVGLFYAFYVLVLNKDTETSSTPIAEVTATVTVASASGETLAPATNTATSVPPTPTVRPTIPATNTPQPTATLRPAPEVITISVRARVNISEGFQINLRDLPSLSGSTVITRLVADAEVDIVDGPEDADDLRWWNVNGGEGQTGWVVEAFGGETWLVPIGWTDQLPPLAVAAPAATPILTPTLATVADTPTLTPTLAPVADTPTAAPTLEPVATTAITATAAPVLTPTVTPEGGIPSPTIGGRAEVTTQYQFINLRSAPGLGSETIGQLPDGTVVTILEGPEELDDLRWWRVDDGQGNSGWAAERVGTEVLLLPIQ